MLSDRRLRTPKFLYAAIKGLPVIMPSWVHESVATGKQVCGKGGTCTLGDMRSHSWEVQGWEYAAAQGAGCRAGSRMPHLPHLQCRLKQTSNSTA